MCRTFKPVSVSSSITALYFWDGLHCVLWTAAGSTILKAKHAFAHLLCSGILSNISEMLGGGGEVDE